MRFLIIFTFCLTGACHRLQEDTQVKTTPPAPVSAPQTVDITKPFKVLPNETHGRPAGTGLNRPAQTVASIGDSARPGLWLETPLVHAAGPGQVRLASGGNGVAVTLLPAPGPVSTTSRLSPDAMRLLGVAQNAKVRLSVSSIRQ